MMAINFPAAAFLAGLKVPNQIMYCISQDPSGISPVVVYKDTQNTQHSVPPWSNQDAAFSQNKEIQQISGGSNAAGNQPQSIRVETTGNQVATIQIPQIPVSSTSVTYSQPTPYYSPAPQIIQAPNYIQLPNQIYTVSSHTQEKNSDEIRQHPTEELVDNTNSEEGKNFSCSLCKKSFRLKSTLIQHERIHLDQRPFTCNYNNNCGKSFRQKSHLIQHSRIHFDQKPFPCTFQGCGKSFRQRAILSQHERIHCDASSHLLYKNLGENGTLWPHDLPYPNELQAKEENNSDNQQKDQHQYPPFTHSVFGNLSDLGEQKTETKSEMSNQQTAMPQYVRCPICQVSYKQKSTLLQHGCVHIESRPYPCLFMKCGKRFRQQSHLAQHIRIHRNEKPYRCPYVECQGRCFRQKTILNQHIRIHTNSKPYRCATCGKDFRQQAILSQHEKTHQSHRPFSCPLSNCKRRFITENELKKHIENHMNPSKPKKQSSRNQIEKSDPAYYPTYIDPANFPHNIDPNQNIQLPQANQIPS